MARELLLIRHGDTGPQHRGRFLGATDVPLSAEGLCQAEALAPRVAAARPGKCLCSPMTRAVETAAGWASLPGAVDADLREIDFGQWEGMTFEEIQASYPDEVSRWAEYQSDFVFPGGEGLMMFAERIRGVCARIASDPAEVMLAVTHGGVIRAMICHLLGLPARNYLLFDASPASISRVTLYDGKGVLTGFNDTCHLEGLSHG